MGYPPPPRVKPTKHNTDTFTTMKAEGFPLFILRYRLLSLKMALEREIETEWLPTKLPMPSVSQGSGRACDASGAAAR